MAAIAASGCVFVSGVPEGVEVQCGLDADCAADQKCSPVRNLCVDASSDIRPPELVRAVFSQGYTARTAVTLVLTADAALSDATVVFAGDGLTLSAPTLAGPEARFTVFVDETTPEGAYAVASVRLVDAEGNKASEDVDGVVLVVDRTAPTPLSVTVQSSGTPGVYADVAPHDEMTVVVDTDVDDVAALDVAVGGLRLGLESGCEKDVAQSRFVCGVDLASEMVLGGPTAVVVRAVDLAGNVADAPAEVVVVDKQPPRIVTDAVQVEFASVGGIAVSAVAAGSRIVIRFVADEPLLQPPEVKLNDGTQDVSFTFLQNVGTAYTFEYVVVDDLITGVHPVGVTMTDVFGHTAEDLPLPLPDPFSDGIQVDDVLLSSCPPPAQMPCADFDGDGFVSPGPGCEGDFDCNDVDPTVYPGAHERPGDGLHNDCNTAGGDMPVDESSGYFVDKVQGDDAGAGSRAAPLLTIDEALGRVADDPERGFVYLAAGQTFTFERLNGSPAASVLGGLVSDEWTRGGEPSLITAPVDVGFQLSESAFLESIDVDTANSSISIVGESTLLDVGGFDNQFCRSRCLVIEPRNTSTYLVDDGIGLRVIGGSMRQLVLRGGTTAVVRTEVTDEQITVEPQARLFGYGATFRGELECDDCALLRLEHCAVRSTPAGDGSVLRALGGPIELLGTTIEQPQGCGVVHLADAGATLKITGSNLFASTGPLIRLGTGACGAGTDVTSIADVDACTFAGCVEAEQNVSVFPILEPDGIHLAPDSPLRDSGPVPSASGAPTLIADVDGTCRYADGAPDIGPDEYF